MTPDDPINNMNTIRVGLIADMHGDYKGFMQALKICEQHNVQRILCAGDVVDRGADADKIIQELRRRDILTIGGNHDRTVVEHQARWRAAPPEKHARLRELGRIISDESVRYLEHLPDTVTLRIANVNILMAHGAPWADVVGIFPTTRDAIINRMMTAHPRTQLFILGHTHHPMCIHYHEDDKIRYVINPGSIYGITIRDSHSCAILTLPDCRVDFFDVQDGAAISVPITPRQA